MRERLNARSDIASQSPSSSSYVHVTPLWATPPPLSRYLNQLDRARRFLHRIANRTAPSEAAMLAGMDEYEDSLWSFFMNCWHVKDWIQNDERLQAVQTEVVKAAHASAMLQVCRSLANGAKHLELDPKRQPANASRAKVMMYTFTHRGDGSVQWDHMVKLEDSRYVTAYDVGIDALREWRRILDASKLPLPLGWKDP